MRENLIHIVNYILQFLLNCEENFHATDKIGYTNSSEDFGKYDLVIIPSDFFGENSFKKKCTYPTLPLKNIGNTPLLFGENRIEKIGKTTILHADIVASTFFLISRYEEIIETANRDKFGRFIGKNSLPSKSNFISRPIVDEYGEILRDLLRKSGVQIVEPQNKINKIYLTHDVDKLAHYRNFRSLIGAFARIFKDKKAAINATKSFFCKIENDPWYTFPFIIEEAQKLSKFKDNIENIFFIKNGGGQNSQDLPLQNIKSSDYSKFFETAKTNGYKFGIHPSFEAGKNPKIISKELFELEKVLDQKIVYSRNHYLANLQPDDFRELITNGITDDFTMGYADIAGFRLGTCRPVKWIDVEKLELTNLTLHPLTTMDNTLDDARYMNLEQKKAFEYTCKLIEQTKRHNGDVNLLWHNTSVVKNLGYQRELYREIIDFLANI